MAWPEWATTSGIRARLRALVSGVTQRERVEQEMQEEIAHHLAARTDDLIREGHAPDEAARIARREFGHVGSLRREAHAARGWGLIAELRFTWLDIRSALRAVRRHPALNAAIVFALAVGIPVGLAPAHLARALAAAIPGDDEGRIRGIRHWDPLASSVATTTAADFLHWRDAMRSFSRLAAFRTASVSIARADATPSGVSAAWLTEGGLQTLDVRPALGRLLDAQDAALGAPDVVVIAHGLWVDRFARDPGALGQELRIGGRPHTIVGVMPEGFRFPSNESLWLPLRVEPGAAERVAVQVFGRLAGEVSETAVRAELAALGPARATSDGDGTARAERARLRAEVVPFGLLFLGLPEGGLASVPEYRYVQLLTLLLVVVASGNVAMLVFARTATRRREFAIRTALGASRLRIVGQVFLETFVLAVLAAGIGLLGVDWALHRVNLASLAGETALPHWLSLGVTSTTAVHAMALAVLSATVAGVVPAVVVTGRAITAHIGGASRMRFGKVTAALVVADIAVSVAAVAMSLAVAGQVTDAEMLRRATGIRAEDYVAFELRRGSAVPELVAALEREPGVQRVALGDALPRLEHRSRPFEVVGDDRGPDAPRRWTRVARVDPDYFRALDVVPSQGRDFTRADADTTSMDAVAIVNAAFVDRWLGGGDALGRRLRLAQDARTGSERWYVVVGVVGPLGVNIVNPDRGEAVYLPMDVAALDPVQMAIRSSLPPVALAERVRRVAATVDPDVVVGRTLALADARQGDWYLVMGLVFGLVLLAVVLIAMATSGLYAMLSLAVTERTREIGIRRALGAPRGSVVLLILRRPLTQILLGALVGLPLAGRFLFELTAFPTGEGDLWRASGTALGLSLTVVLLVGVGACLVPLRRILAVQPSEAMRADS